MVSGVGSVCGAGGLVILLCGYYFSEVSLPVYSNREKPTQEKLVVSDKAFEPKKKAIEVIKAKSESYVQDTEKHDQNPMPKLEHVAKIMAKDQEQPECTSGTCPLAHVQVEDLVLDRGGVNASTEPKPPKCTTHANCQVRTSWYNDKSQDRDCRTYPGGKFYCDSDGKCFCLCVKGSSKKVNTCLKHSKPNADTVDGTPCPEDEACPNPVPKQVVQPMKANPVQYKWS